MRDLTPIIAMLKVCKETDLEQIQILLTNLTTKSIKSKRTYKVEYNKIELIDIK